MNNNDIFNSIYSQMVARIIVIVDFISTSHGPGIA